MLCRSCVAHDSSASQHCCLRYAKYSRPHALNTLTIAPTPVPVLGTQNVNDHRTGTQFASNRDPTVIVVMDASTRVSPRLVGVAAARACGGRWRSCQTRCLKRQLSLPVDDIAVVGGAVEERRRHLRVAEHARPFAEGEIGRDDDRRAFVEPADQMEQGWPPAWAKGR